MLLLDFELNQEKKLNSETDYRELNLKNFQTFYTFSQELFPKKERKIIIDGKEPSINNNFREILRFLAKNNQRVTINTDLPFIKERVSEKSERRKSSIKPFSYISYFKEEFTKRKNFIKWINTHNFQTDKKLGVLEKIVIKNHHLTSKKRDPQDDDLSFLIKSFFGKNFSKHYSIVLEEQTNKYPQYIGITNNFIIFGIENNDDTKGTDFLMNRYQMIERLLKSNWTYFNRQNREKQILIKNYLDMKWCPNDNLYIFSSNGEIYRCSRKILPPEENVFSGKIFLENKKFMDTFSKNGPIGLAKNVGLNSNTIHHILVTKGPCYLCHKAVEIYQNKD